MEHELAKFRRHMDATLAEMNRHLDNAETKKDPQRHAMVTATARHAVGALKDLDDMDARPYSDTKIGFGADRKQNKSPHGNTRDDAVDDLVNAINKILPHIADDFEWDIEDRQGVPGTGPYANPRLRRRGGRKGIGRRRYEADTYDDVDDDERKHEAVARVAADAAAMTARHMATNPHTPHNPHNIYPTTPVMPHNDARHDTRHDDTTADRTRNIGPGTRD